MSAKVLRWEKLNESLIQKTVVFDVKSRRMRSPDGSIEADFFAIECNDWVNIVPLTADRRILLVEQFRHGIQDFTLEIPGGIIAKDKTPLEAALAELEEETGYSSTEIFPLGAFHPNPAIQTNLAHLFLATNCRPAGGQRLDELEDIAIHRLPLEDLAGYVDTGKISHCLTLSALYQARNRFPKLGI